MVTKIYAGVGKGKNLWEAFLNDAERGHSRIFDNWIEEQQKGYMGKDWDYDRINKVIWDMESQCLINFFTRINVDLNDEFDREIFPEWLRKAKTRSERKAIKELIEFFEHDLGDKRNEWAYERAQEDFDFCRDIDSDNDEEVANFLGVKLVIEGVEINGEEYNLLDVEFCTNCGEANAIEEMKENYENDNGDDFNESHYYCNECGNYYPYDEEHCRLNKHKPVEEIIARRV